MGFAGFTFSALWVGNAREKLRLGTLRIDTYFGAVLAPWRLMRLNLRGISSPLSSLTTGTSSQSRRKSPGPGTFFYLFSFYLYSFSFSFSFYLYLSLCLSQKNKKKTKHRIVCLAFLAIQTDDLLRV